MKTEKKTDRLQEIANRYGVILYEYKDRQGRAWISGVGLVQHDGCDCLRVSKAVKEAARR